MVRIISIILLLISHASLANEPLYLCKGNEQVIFGCQIKGKFISICASKNLSRTTGYAQYRFGKPGKIEFSYPVPAKAPEGIFFLGSTPYSGGGANIVRFNNSGYEYLIFDSMTRVDFEPDEIDYDDPDFPKYKVEFKAGIVTRHNGKITSTRLCEEDWASVQHIAFKVFEREDFDFTVIP